MSTPASPELWSLLQRAESLRDGALADQLAWLEEAAHQVENAGLGEDGVVIGRELRAALGAILIWARGSQDPRTLPELVAVVRTLTARALCRLYRTLGQLYDELGEGQVPHADVCRELAAALRELAEALLRGEPSWPELRQRVEALRARLS